MLNHEEICMLEEICDLSSAEYLLRQLAEECIELAQACIFSRTLSINKIAEEICDVELCSEALRMRLKLPDKENEFDFDSDHTDFELLVSSCLHLSKCCLKLIRSYEKSTIMSREDALSSFELRFNFTLELIKTQFKSNNAIKNLVEKYKKEKIARWLERLKESKHENR